MTQVSLVEPRPTPHIVSETMLKFYQAIDGIPTLKDSELLHLFVRAKEERLLPLVMYNVDPATPPEAFLRLFRLGGGRMLWLVLHEGKLAGWVWLDDLANRTARTHFCLFRWVSQSKLSETIGRAVFRELFSMKFRKNDGLQVLRAEMPAFNKPGLWFLQKIGLKVMGEIPNGAFRFSTNSFCPMVCLYATKDMI